MPNDLCVLPFGALYSTIFFFLSTRLLRCIKSRERCCRAWRTVSREGGGRREGNGKWKTRRCKKGRLIAGDLSHGVGECIVFFFFAIVSNCLVILMDTTPAMADSFDEWQPIFSASIKFAYDCGVVSCLMNRG